MLVTGLIGVGVMYGISEIIKGLMGNMNFKNFDSLFKELELCNKSEDYPDVVDKVKDEYYTKYTIKMPIGLSISNIEQYEEAICSFLESESVTIKKQSNSSFIDIMHMHNKPKINYNPCKHKRDDFLVPLGVNLYNGEPLLFDIFNDSNANMYICGSPGQGKSNIVNLILSHLANNKSVDDVQFAINDSKVVDLPIFENCKNTVSYYSGPDNIHEFIDNELNEMEARFVLLKKYGFKNLRDMKKSGHNIPFRVVVIEEISTFSNDDLFQKKLSDLTSKCRSAGITVMLITQTPTYDIMPTRIKNSVNVSIGLKVRNHVCSEIIMNDADLHKLTGTGHFKINDYKNYNLEAQSYCITDECIEEIINQNR